jgi:hypothetical protein
MTRLQPWEEGYVFDFSGFDVQNVQQHMKLSHAVPFGEAEYVWETRRVYGKRFASFWQVRIAGHDGRVLYKGSTKTRTGARLAGWRALRRMA